jgi:transposase
MGGGRRQLDVASLSEAELRELVVQLLHQVADLERQLFGRRSEKARYLELDPKGLLPFPEFAQLLTEAQTAQAKEAAITVPAHTRRKPARRGEFPEHLPRRRMEYTLSEEDRRCPRCGGCRQEIGEEISHKLESIEVRYVEETARKKYACHHCEGEVVIAPGPAQVLDKCILGTGFLAQIIFERFANHMPYARLEKKYAAEGLDLSRSVMCSSAIRCAELLEPVVEAHRDEVLASMRDSVLQCDDTEVVQRNGPRKGRSKVHVWAWRDQHGGVFYEVTPTRNRDGPEMVIGERRGRLQTDGHECYDGLDEDRVTRIGCWSHVRRYFDKALRIGDVRAKEPLAWIGKLFLIERIAKEGRDRRPLTNAELVELRHERSAPVLAALKSWLETAQLEQLGLPKGPLMTGVGYALKRWTSLSRFLEDGAIREISNNGCERALRALVIGRTNWQWFGSEEGARAGCVLMSLVQSCKELGINPLLYLRDVLQAVATTPASRVRDLTPTGWNRRQANAQVAQAQKAITAVVRELIFCA